MKIVHTALIAMILMLGFAASGPAFAHGRVGVFIGAPLFWPGYYPAPYYYGYGPYYAPGYYPPYAVEQGPTTYVERSANEAAPAPPPQQHWYYYCKAAKGYYPYVKECPAGWQ